MEGQHIVILGSGALVPRGLDINAVQGVDLDLDGIPDSARFYRDSPEAAPNVALQYYYHVTPRLGLGLNVAFSYMEAHTSALLGPITLSGGATRGGFDYPDYSNASQSIKINSLHVIPVVRYVMWPLRRANPYLLGGLGVHRMSVKSSVGYRLAIHTDPALAPPVERIVDFYQRDAYSRTSFGLAGTIGGGVEIFLSAPWVLGLEGRWVYSQLDADAFGDASWQSLAGYLWVGWKWTAPL